VAANVEIVAPQIGDVDYIADNMRDADRIEVRAIANLSPKQALERSLYSEVAYTVVVNDEPCCMFGFARASALSDVGVPWLLGTELVNSIPVKFLRESKRIVDDFMRSGKYAKLENWIDSENEVSLRWLKWLGFTVRDDVTLVRGGRTFYYFNKEGEV
jgi:hypothetical protein